MKREKVYIETSIISYLCARPSRDLIVSANQELTLEWWDNKRSQYDCYISEFVMDEISAGDPDAAAKRIQSADGIPFLLVNEVVGDLQVQIIQGLNLPKSIATDAAHIAIAVVHSMDYLLTLNCTHIANPYWQHKLRGIITAQGFEMPEMCTPRGLLEGEML